LLGHTNEPILSVHSWYILIFIVFGVDCKDFLENAKTIKFILLSEFFYDGESGEGKELLYDNKIDEEIDIKNEKKSWADQIDGLSYYSDQQNEFFYVDWYVDIVVKVEDINSIDELKEWYILNKPKFFDK